MPNFDTGTGPARSLNDLIHEVKQPLNIIQLSCDNLRGRLLSSVSPEDAAYLSRKLDRIEAQVNRAADLLLALQTRAASPDADD